MPPAQFAKFGPAVIAALHYCVSHMVSLYSGSEVGAPVTTSFTNVNVPALTARSAVSAGSGKTLLIAEYDLC